MRKTEQQIKNSGYMEPFKAGKRKVVGLAIELNYEGGGEGTHRLEGGGRITASHLSDRPQRTQDFCNWGLSFRNRDKRRAQ